MARWVGTEISVAFLTLSEQPRDLEAARVSEPAERDLSQYRSVLRPHLSRGHEAALLRGALAPPAGQWRESSPGSRRGWCCLRTGLAVQWDWSHR